jgi:hypothetical protein
MACLQTLKWKCAFYVRSPTLRSTALSRDEVPLFQYTQQCCHSWTGRSAHGSHTALDRDLLVNVELIGLLPGLSSACSLYAMLSAGQRRDQERDSCVHKAGTAHTRNPAARTVANNERYAVPTIVRCCSAYIATSHIYLSMTETSWGDVLGCLWRSRSAVQDQIIPGSGVT